MSIRVVQVNELFQARRVNQLEFECEERSPVVCFIVSGYRVLAFAAYRSENRFYVTPVFKDQSVGFLEAYALD